MYLWKIIALLIHQQSVYDNDDNDNDDDYDDDDDDNDNNNNNNNNVGKNKLLFLIIHGYVFWSGLSEKILCRVNVNKSVHLNLLI